MLRKVQREDCILFNLSMGFGAQLFGLLCKTAVLISPYLCIINKDTNNIH